MHQDIASENSQLFLAHDLVIESSFSDWLPIVSGVPQGSILGPFLFLLYINDLPSIVSPESTLALFADDSKCFRSIKAFDGLVGVSG